jgi:hypothetical protein
VLYALFFIFATLLQIDMNKLLALLFILSLFSCKKEPEVLPTDDNELITTVELVFTDAANVSRSFKFRDLDGDSRTKPESFDTLKLARNTDYTVKILIGDESKGSLDDITEDIKDESDVHLFVYRPTPVSLLAIQITDLDKNALPVGLLAKAKTQYIPGTGFLQILLKHQPMLNGKVVKTGDEDAGSTDLDLSFPVIIK